MTLSRVRRYVIAAVLVPATFVGGWLAAVSFQSPEQREAAAEPPPPGPIVASVTKGRLADEITTRATVTRKGRHGLRLRAVPENATVTSIVARRGNSVFAGAVLLTINGRPLFVMPGTFAFYRDLSPGLEGPDVAQLQAGLEAAGHDIADSEMGLFGPATQQAVLDLYTSRGFQPLLASPSQAHTRARSANRGSEPAPVPTVPLTEVAVASRLPAVLSTTAEVGDRAEPDQVLATLATGSLVARASIVVQAAARLKPGMGAELSANSGPVARATVTSISSGKSSPATEPGDSGSADPIVLFTPKSPLPANWEGKNVLVRIRVGLRTGESLLVPSRAVTGGINGEASVLKRRDDGSFMRVPVRELRSFGGRSAVEPLHRGALVPGDEVRVG